MNLKPHIAAQAISSNTELLPEEAPRPSFTAAPVIAVIAAPHLCAWIAFAEADVKE